MILLNALTYTNYGGDVEVTTGMQSSDGIQSVGFTVRNSGHGIPKDDHEKVLGLTQNSRHTAKMRA
jgi:signal transduction histidine kinase